MEALALKEHIVCIPKMPWLIDNILIDAWMPDHTKTAEKDESPSSTMLRPQTLTYSGTSGTPQRFFFTRRRPTYADPGHNEIFTVGAYSVRGNGIAEDALWRAT